MSKDSGKVSSTVAERIVADLVLIAVGVLFCLKLATTVVSITLGVALCLYGVANVVFTIVRKESLFTAAGVLYGVAIALGIACIVLKPLGVFVQLIPYIFCAVGGVFVLDACFARFARKDIGLIPFLFEIVMGVALLVLGLCLIFVESFRSTTSVLFGIALIVFGVYRLIELIVSKK